MEINRVQSNGKSSANGRFLDKKMKNCRTEMFLDTPNECQNFVKPHQKIT